MLRMTRAVLPTMRAQRSGTIINVGSISGHIPVPFTGFYPATKAALRTISEALSMEVEPFGIKVSLVEPGFFRTNILADQDAHPIDPQSPYLAGETKTREFWGSSVANGRDPAEVIDLIVSLGRTPTPPLHSIIDHDQWIPARFANDDAGWSELLKSVVGY
jgi:NAD(P)-dependent dehydrogenase (short-subunit alcohol dehydrogenase family)